MQEGEPANPKKRARLPRIRREIEGFRLPPHERMPIMVAPTAGCRCLQCVMARLGGWDFKAHEAWLELSQASTVQLELKLPDPSVRSPSVPEGNPRPKAIVREVVEYERDPRIVAHARARAGGRCEVPGCTYEPFTTTGAEPYFEVHHIIPLHEAGPDTPDNVACICPRHHREIHFGIRGAEINDQLSRLPGRRVLASRTTAP